MPSYRNAEYRDLLAAEDFLREDMKVVDPSDRTTVIATLVKVIDMKRLMRGVGNPKPVDYSKRRRRATTSVPQVPTDIAPPTAAASAVGAPAAGLSDALPGGPAA